jgi:tRNA U34 5-carboxymethylaminomethyl modifying enzyme MnmG/GidA
MTDRIMLPRLPSSSAFIPYGGMDSGDDRVVCWHTHTNATTHKLLMEHAHLLPVFDTNANGPR